MNLDTVMLGFMKSDIDVGYYNAAVKIKVILVQVVASLGGVLLPRCSYYVEKGIWADFKRICSKALNFVVVIALPLSVYFIIYAQDAIMFLSGSEALVLFCHENNYAYSFVYWHDEHIGITNISSIRKRKNSFIFRSGWCYNRLVVECRVNS